MPNIKEINRIDELAEYRSAWQSLLTETAGATFFQSLDWLEVVDRTETGLTCFESHTP